MDAGSNPDLTFSSLINKGKLQLSNFVVWKRADLIYCFIEKKKSLMNLEKHKGWQMTELKFKVNHPWKARFRHEGTISATTFQTNIYLQ